MAESGHFPRPKVVTQLLDDARDFWVPREVQRVKHVPSALEFARMVARNQPIIFEGLCADWAATRKWTREYLEAAVGDKLVSVAVTPNGLGDAVISVDSTKLRFPADIASATNAHEHFTESVKCFVQPDERTMTLGAFFKLLQGTDEAPEMSNPCDTKDFDSQESGAPKLQGSNSNQIAYLSFQNDSLREQFGALLDDVPDCIGFAKDAFGNAPDAVNLWIGDDRAVTTMHVDHYENMYAVVEGEKHFVLLPPCSAMGLYEREFPQARYKFIPSTKQWLVEFILNEEHSTDGSCRTAATPRNISRVPWVEVDPVDPDLQRFPRFRTHCVKPVSCTVKKGDILYLPALWYHRVAQKGLTIAVNYWHDMDFMGPNFVYTSMLKQIAHGMKDSSSEELQQSWASEPTTTQ